MIMINHTLEVIIIFMSVRLVVAGKKKDFKRTKPLHTYLAIINKVDDLGMEVAQKCELETTCRYNYR